MESKLIESKKNKALTYLNKNDHLLLCPLCGERLFADDDYTLKCDNGHSYDISKKGVVNFAGKGNDKIYDSSLFASRRKILTARFYEPLTNAIVDMIMEHNSEYLHSEYLPMYILDAGCGEGSFLNDVCNGLRGKIDQSANYDNNIVNGDSTDCDSAENDHIQSKVYGVGIDLSKKGVELASDYSDDSLWIVDDLSNIHLASGEFDVILNILSPANYKEFGRLLKCNHGIIVKVIPGNDYLNELREAANLTSKDKNNSNNKTDAAAYNSDTNNKSKNTNNVQTSILNVDSFSHASKEMNVLDSQNIKYQLKLSEEEFKTFADMTPLTHGKEITFPNKNSYELTIDLHIIIGRPI